MGLDGRNNPFLTGKHLDGNSARIKITQHKHATAATVPAKGLSKGLPGLKGSAAKQDYLPVSPLLRLEPVLLKQAEYLTRCAMSDSHFLTAGCVPISHPNLQPTTYNLNHKT